MTTATPRFAHVQLTTGVRLRYTEQGDRSRPALILLHGYSDSWFSYSGVLPALAEEYRVFALDQRGHGESDRPAHSYAMSDFAADVIAFMDALGLARASIIGHSMGTFIAQQTALLDPERIERVVLIAGAANPRNIVGAFELQGAVDALTDPVAREFAHEFQASTVHRPIEQNFLARVVDESLKLPACVWQETAAGFLAVDYTPRLGEIEAPVLVMWGDQDGYCPRAEQEVLLRGLRRAQLEVYEQTGHSIHWEQPARFVEDVQLFLTQS